MNPDHAEIQLRLDEYIDGDLSAQEREQVEQHLALCGECTAEVAEIRALLAHARELPREAAPSRDLWPEILARIDTAPAQVRPTARIHDLAARRRPGVRWTAVGRAAAVVTLVAVSSGVTAYLVRTPSDPGIVALRPATAEPTPSGDISPSPATVASTEPGPVSRATPPSRQDPVRLASRTADPGISSFEAGTGGFDGAVEQLNAVFERDRDRLSPETVKVIEQNLAVIDTAIAESRAALANDPTNPELPLLLSGVYRQKVELLQSAVQLQARS